MHYFHKILYLCVNVQVGTLGTAGFRDVISHLRRLAAAADKKTYTFLMGKPNPAKLGNFPEVSPECPMEHLLS